MTHDIIGQQLDEALRLVTTAYVRCTSCNGSGLATNDHGEPDTCSACRGDCTERARDSHGRFTVVPTDAELFPAYVEFAARQAVADLKREVGKTKASFMLSKFLEEDNER